MCSIALTLRRNCGKMRHCAHFARNCDSKCVSTAIAIAAQFKSDEKHEFSNDSTHIYRNCLNIAILRAILFPKPIEPSFPRKGFFCLIFRFSSISQFFSHYGAIAAQSKRNRTHGEYSS